MSVFSHFSRKRYNWRRFTAIAVITVITVITAITEMPKCRNTRTFNCDFVVKSAANSRQILAYLKNLPFTYSDNSAYPNAIPTMPANSPGGSGTKPNSDAKGR